MTAYLLRTDDGREWTLPGGSIYSIRNAAFNILFRERIGKGVVWIKRTGRQKGEAPRWIIDGENAKFTVLSKSGSDHKGWRNLAHELTYFEDDDYLIIDRELYDEQSVGFILDSVGRDQIDVRSRRLKWARNSIEFYDPDESCQYWRLSETRGPGAFPVWVYERQGVPE